MTEFALLLKPRVACMQLERLVRQVGAVGARCQWVLAPLPAASGSSCRFPCGGDTATPAEWPRVPSTSVTCRWLGGKTLSLGCSRSQHPGRSSASCHAFVGRRVGSTGSCNSKHLALSPRSLQPGACKSSCKALTVGQSKALTVLLHACSSNVAVD